MKRLLILFMIAYPLTAYAQPCKPPAACQPGDKVSVTIPPVDRTKFNLPRVTLAPVKGTAEKLDLPLLSSTDSQTVVWFFIPKEAPDGTYWIQIMQKPKSDQPCSSQTNGCVIDDLAPSEVVIQSPSISAVSPPAAFEEDKDGNQGVNEVTIVGSGFREGMSDFRFDGLRTPDHCAVNAQMGQKKNCLELTVKND